MRRIPHRVEMIEILSAPSFPVFRDAPGDKEGFACSEMRRQVEGSFWDVIIFIIEVDLVSHIIVGVEPLIDRPDPIHIKWRERLRSSS